MPFIRIQALEGRTDQQKEVLAKSIVQNMIDQGFASKESIHVIFEDMEKEDYFPGGKFELD